MTARHNWAVRALAVSSLAGLMGGTLFHGVYRLLHSRYDWDGILAADHVRVRATAEVMTLGPPLVLLALYAGVGLSKGQLKEGLREWWSSVCARLLAIASVWLAVDLVA
jgi:hypothetical protein